jgi:hypothetical protein
VVSEIREFISILEAQRAGKKSVRILLTVSPVPLTATMSGRHVLLATTYSKAILRAAAGQLESENSNIDYFPSYEIITSPWNNSNHFEKNMRSVKETGVDIAMNSFLSQHCHDVGTAMVNSNKDAASEFSMDSDISFSSDAICEDFLLDSFSKGKR